MRSCGNNNPRFSLKIYTMQHRGEIIRKAVYNSGYTITDIAKGIGKSRKWMYLMFENSNVSLDVVLKIGKIIHYDFTEDIKEFSHFLKTSTIQQTSIFKEEHSADYWKDKYLQLLEEYNALLKKQENK
jgi:predicted transcriptional regulator